MNETEPPAASGAVHEPARGAAWWIATGRKQDNGHRVLGPFGSRELALEVRTLAERVWRCEGAFWVVTGDEIPSDSLTPTFFEHKPGRRKGAAHA